MGRLPDDPETLRRAVILTGPRRYTGIVRGDIARVRIRYRTGGATRWRDAPLLRATDPLALRRARLHQRFGVFSAELPSGARRVVATAFDDTGERRIGDDYGHLRARRSGR